MAGVLILPRYKKTHSPYNPHSCTSTGLDKPPQITADFPLVNSLSRLGGWIYLWSSSRYLICHLSVVVEETCERSCAGLRLGETWKEGALKDMQCIECKRSIHIDWTNMRLKPPRSQYVCGRHLAGWRLQHIIHLINLSQFRKVYQYFTAYGWQQKRVSGTTSQMHWFS